MVIKGYYCLSSEKVGASYVNIETQVRSPQDVDRLVAILQKIGEAFLEADPRWDREEPFSEEELEQVAAETAETEEPL